ncbi:uncharacterized protein LOC120077203 [Benincasa hispida]|uniref:uncharacterized protein LOC120077203 n=1 Tax=Benincasa hispida TaxID=102211 RepID=UPI0018FFBE80|nr:uncharacterized protein LOC120077203 [Benincasa hispida]
MEQIHSRFLRVDWYPAQYTTLSHIKHTNIVIKRKLSPAQLDMFRRTIFGGFIYLNIIFSSGLIHEALLREIVDDREECMTFNIIGSTVTFKKVEFLLVLGLWSPTLIIERTKFVGYRLRDTYFKREGLTLFDLEKEYPECEFANDEDVVKVSLVYYMELTMMGKDKHTSIDSYLFQGTNDLDCFNNMD